MAVFANIVVYIRCSSDIKEKITRIDAIIEALEDQLLTAATSSDIDEYRLDDGQTIIKTVFRDPGAIEDTIQKLLKRRSRLQNLCSGYRYGLQDGNVKL